MKLTIIAAKPQKGAECEPINFDPLVMADGIAPTNDPVLKFRPPANLCQAVWRAVVVRLRDDLKFPFFSPGYGVD
jgi:hypothetical protein